MFCPKCGTTVAEDDIFCRKCGKPLQVATEGGIVVEGNVNTRRDFVGRDLVKTVVLHLKEPGTYIIQFSGLIALITILLLSYLAYQSPTILTLVQSFFDRLQIPIKNEETIPSTPVVLPTLILTFTPTSTETQTETPLPTNTATFTPEVTRTPIVTMTPIPTTESTFNLKPVLIDISKGCPATNDFTFNNVVIPSTLRAVVDACSEINENWACYGNHTVRAYPSEIRFYEPSDRQPISIIERFEIDQTGAVLMRLRSSGQSVIEVIAIAGPEQSSTPAADPTITIELGVSNRESQAAAIETVGRWGLAKTLGQPSIEDCSLPLPLVIKSGEYSGHSITINDVKAIEFK